MEKLPVWETEYPRRVRKDGRVIRSFPKPKPRPYPRR